MPDLKTNNNNDQANEDLSKDVETGSKIKPNSSSKINLTKESMKINVSDEENGEDYCNDDDKNNEESGGNTDDEEDVEDEDENDHSNVDSSIG